MSRILFIIQDRTLPSSRIRVLHLLPALEKAGFVCDVMAYPRRITGRFAMWRKARQADVVILQKKLPSPIESRVLRWCSSKLVFDFDDAIYCKHESEGDVISRSRQAKTRALLRHPDLVIVGNEILKRYAESLAANVKIIPSCVEVANIPLKDHRQSDGPLVIGWVGGHINLPHLQGLSAVLQHLATSYDLEVRVVCDEGLMIPGVRVRHIPWTLETQHAEIARFDIGIMPLPASQHAEGKCGYKAIQCMAAGVPVVVSDIGINRKVVAHGVEGFVARDAVEFERYLEQLITQPELRAEMGARAREKAVREYSIEKGGHLLIMCLTELLQAERN